MARIIPKSESKSRERRPPATTPEGRENQLIALAMEVAEEQMLNRTASSQVLSYFLKIGSTKEQIEKQILLAQQELIQAKTKQIQSAEHMEELYINAIKAMRSYSGGSVDEEG